jgi:hypothetical protein
MGTDIDMDTGAEGGAADVVTGMPGPRGRSRTRRARRSRVLLGRLAPSLSVGLCLALGGRAGAVERAFEMVRFDDPKLAREWAGALGDAAPATVVPPAPAPVPRSRPASSSPPAAAPRPVAPARTLAQLDPVAPDAGGPLRGPAGSVAVVARPVEPAPAGAPPGGGDGSWPYRPRLELAYRRFSLGAIGTSATAAAPAAAAGGPEAFESLSLDVYPVSRILRVGTSTQFGWHDGQFDRSGDYFLAQSFSSGFQIPGRFTPFAEALAGAGYMRRVQADSTLPGAYWQVGVEGGVEVYMLGRAYTSVAVGYLHTDNLLLLQHSLTSVKQDAWMLKLGIGI